MEVINNHRKKLIVLGVIIEIILVLLIFKNVISLKNKNADNNISNINEIGKQEFGIMYRDSDTDSYKSYSGSIIDAINNRYALNVGNSKCSDGSGATVTPSSVLSISGSTVTIKSNKTVYYTLYFDKKKTITALDIVASKPKSLSPNADQGDMYRYQGTSTLVNNNYIFFGTDNKTTCTSDEDHYMYRIIGITSSGEMKLIKETPVKEGDNTLFGWDTRTNLNTTSTDNQGCGVGDCEWPSTLLYKRLNGTSNGTVQGKGTSTDTNGNTNIFVDGYTNEYPYMKKTSTWYGKISEHDWMYGDTNVYNYNGHEMYKIETGQKETTRYYLSDESETYKWNPETDKVTAKIGLPYLYDWELTYYEEGNNTTRGNASTYDKLTTSSWMKNYFTYSLSRCASFGVNPWFVLRMLNPPADIDYCSYTSGVMITHNGQNIYPVFYVTNTAEMEGSGLETDPYRIVN